MDQQQLRHLVLTIGADQARGATALRAADPSRALVEGVLAPRLRELESLPPKQLRAETLRAGVDSDELYDALDESDDRTATMLELLIAAASMESARSRSASPEPDEPPAEPVEEGVPPPAAGGGGAAMGLSKPLDDDDEAVVLAFYREHQPALATSAQYTKISRGFQKKASKLSALAAARCEKRLFWNRFYISKRSFCQDRPGTNAAGREHS
eukprot:COSAG06_NODE_6674_length_2830_cov_6.665324_2_plen_212_part_00